MPRVSLAQIGRRLLGKVSAKHKTKRCWRFVANERVEVHDALRGVTRRLLQRRKKPLVAACDWTDLRGFCTLKVSPLAAFAAVVAATNKVVEGNWG